MLRHLSDVESQILKKINDFDTNNPGDYVDGYEKILTEIRFASSKNA